MKTWCTICDALHRPWTVGSELDIEGASVLEAQRRVREHAKAMLLVFPSGVSIVTYHRWFGQHYEGNNPARTIAWCEICEAIHTPWEPGQPLHVPCEDVLEARRRVRAHARAIVGGAGPRGITVRDYYRLFGEDYSGPDADQKLICRDAVEAA